MKRIYSIEAWCVDCGRCEVACKTFHSLSKNPVSAYKYEAGDPFPPQARIRVEGGKLASVAVNCRHCEHPSCVDGCISGAMRKNPVTGMVTCDPEKCVGCCTCVSLCPYGAVHVEWAGREAVAFKCDLCSEQLGVPGEPSCVAACPNRALIYVESEEC